MKKENMRNGNHEGVENDSKSICHFFIYALNEVHFMVEKDLLSLNLVIISLAEQTSEQSRKKVIPRQPLLSIFHEGWSCSWIIVMTRKVLFGLCSPPAFCSLGTLCMFCICQPFTRGFCLLLFCFLVKCYFFTYV